MRYDELNMYNLLVVKGKGLLSIEKVRSRGDHLSIDYTADVKRFNDYYYVSTDLEKLEERAREIKSKWTKELEDKLEVIDRIKI